MASYKRKGKAKMIPQPYSIADNVFPVVPFRTQFGTGIVAAANMAGIAAPIDTTSATIVAGNVGQEVELDLDFESNEVFDVMGIELSVDFVTNLAFFTNQEIFRYAMGLTDDPDKATATDILLETTFETDESFIWLKYGTWEYGSAVDTSAALKTCDDDRFNFIQPWTVARNLKWIFESSATNAGDVTSVGRVVIWGRRRNASDSEFKSIIYRQRF